IFMADKTSLLEIAQFVVKENYSHHLSSFTEKEINKLKDYKIIEGKILTKSGNAMTVNVIEEIVRELVKYDEK
ncbi:MAG: hypothetical protein N4Q82_01885, partial [Lactobacillus iners]|nr:hypothetical protein [Lactobacillus iners]